MAKYYSNYHIIDDKWVETKMKKSDNRALDIDTEFPILLKTVKERDDEIIELKVRLSQGKEKLFAEEFQHRDTKNERNVVSPTVEEMIKHFIENNKYSREYLESFVENGHDETLQKLFYDSSWNPNLLTKNKKFGKLNSFLKGIVKLFFRRGR